MAANSKSSCFVYKVLAPMEVRYAPSSDDGYRTGRSFYEGDLVSIDLVVSGEEEKTYNNESHDGPFLRLSDGSGWLFQRKAGKDDLLMIAVPVETGLWNFYIGNINTGMAVRNHPMDQCQDQNIALMRVPEKLLPPMHKIFCDRKVRGKDGVNFYRLQEGEDSPASWVFDMRLDSSGQLTATMLYPESRVQSGSFAFRAVQNLAIRSIPTISDKAKTSWSIKQNETIDCDVILKNNSLQPNTGSGPFLRLKDGTGWLFANKNGEEMMKEVPLQEGRWKLLVKNPVGIALRVQPIERGKYCIVSKVYEVNKAVMCDRRIPPRSPGKPTFYRVLGTSGWVFDNREDGHTMMQLLTGERGDPATTPSNQGGWTVEFVRGAAAAATNGIEEIFFNADSRMISFRHPDGARINVYYTTRTIGTALNHPHQGNTQLFRRNCSQDELIEILKNPRVHTGHGYYRASNKRPRADVVPSTMAKGEDIDIEEDFRNRLCDLDNEINNMHGKRRAMWESISSHNELRLKKSTEMYKSAKRHAKILKEEAIQAEQVRKAAEQKRQAEIWAQQELQSRTCSQCGRVFGSAVAAVNHFKDTHQAYTCDVCGRWCKNRIALNQHINATGHW